MNIEQKNETAESYILHWKLPKLYRVKIWLNAKATRCVHYADNVTTATMIIHYMSERSELQLFQRQ